MSRGPQARATCPTPRILALCALTWSGVHGLPGAAHAQSVPQAGGFEAGFDCQKAQSPVERAICASAEIAAADRAMAIAYRALLQRSEDPAFTAALRRDQQDFVALRARAYQDSPRDAAALQQLLDRTELRAEALNWWHSEAAPNVTGTWSNLWGTLVVTQGADGVLQLKAETMDQLAGRWRCGYDDGLVEISPGVYRGRTLTDELVLRQEGATLVQSESFCDETGPSAFGSLQGTYFRVGAPD